MMYYQNCLGTKNIEIEYKSKTKACSKVNYECNSFSSSYQNDNDRGDGRKNRKRKEHKEGILALFGKSCKDCTVSVKDQDDGHGNNKEEDGNDQCTSQSHSYDQSDGNGDDVDKNEVSLYMVITDGEQSYHGRLSMDSMKLLSTSNNDVSHNIYCEKDNKKGKKSTQSKKRHHLSNLLLHPMKDITVSYKYSQRDNILNCTNDNIQTKSSHGYTNSYSNDHSYNSDCVDLCKTTDENSTNHDCIKILIKQSIRNMVRIVYSGQLLPSTPTLSSSNENTNNNKNHNQQSNLMPLLYSITKSFNQSQTKIETLQTQNKTLQKQLHGWKDTATKLDNEWQKDKDETMANYLVLLNNVKRELRSVKEELEKEKSKSLYLKKQQLQNQQSRDINSSLDPTTNVSFVDQYDADDHEEEVFDANEVELLSQGVKVDYHNGEDDKLTPNLTFSSSSLPLSKQLPMNRKRKRNRCDTTATNGMNRYSSESSDQAVIKNVINATPGITLPASFSLPKQEPMIRQHSQLSSTSTRLNPLNGTTEIYTDDGLFPEEDHSQFI